MAAILEIQNLSKSYGRIKAVDNLSISVGQGSIYGILGPNGSGKTTTLGIILSVINANSGSYSWFGKAPSHDDRRKIGAFIESPNFYPYLSAVQNLKIVATIKQTNGDTVEDVLKVTGLYQRRNSKFKTYSLGMKQRLALAAALLGNPDVLVLDEPTNGLDPQGIAEIRNLIIEIGNQGKTIILASHLLDEVEKVCTHVAILKSGKLITSGKVSEVLADEDELEVASSNMEQLESALKELQGFKSLQKAGEKFIVKFDQKISTEEVNKQLSAKGVSVSLLNVKKKSLEKQFLELTDDNA